MSVLFLNIILQIFIVVGAEAKFSSAQADCLPARCGDSGPEIRFPFWLKGLQPESCGYPRPEFMLSCSPVDNTTELDIQYPVTASTINTVSVFTLRVKFGIDKIYYNSQELNAPYITGDCLPKQLPVPPPDSNVSSSESFPFKLDPRTTYSFTLFNCSSNNNASNTAFTRGNAVNCLTGDGYKVVALSSYYSVSDFILPSCAKMYTISDVPSSILHAAPPRRGGDNVVYATPILLWSEPSCGSCEAQGKYCKLMPNTTNHVQTQCVDHPGQPSKHGVSKKYVKKYIKVVVVPLLVLLVLSVLLYYIFSWKRRKDQQRKIEKFLEDYRALRPIRFTYTDIKKMTEWFKEKLGQGGYGTVYKGKLSNDVLVAVKVLKISKGNGEEFINEVGTIGKIHHVNVVRLVGYCSDRYNRALVYEFLPNDSLEKVISSRKKIIEIGWQKLQEIAIGVAKGLDYLHQGCNQRILHFDIKPQNILLDHHFNPKVADFGLAKLCSKEQSVVFMTAARGTIGYIAPEIFSRNFGSVSYKSDVYSFGMLMLDMIGGRKRFQNAEDHNSSSEIYFPEWMYNQLEKGGHIAIQIDKEEDGEIFKKLAIVGLWCIQWYPADRPSMKVVLQLLEGENMPLMPPNPFASTITTTYTCGITSSSSSEMSTE